VHARSCKVSYAGVYLFLWLGLGLIIPTSRANLVLRVIWQCNIFGTTSAWIGGVVWRVNLKIATKLAHAWMKRPVFHRLPEPNRAWLLVVYFSRDYHVYIPNTYLVGSGRVWKTALKLRTIPEYQRCLQSAPFGRCRQLRSPVSTAHSWDVPSACRPFSTTHHTDAVRYSEIIPPLRRLPTFNQYTTTPCSHWKRRHNLSNSMTFLVASPAAGYSYACLVSA